MQSEIDLRFCLNTIRWLSIWKQIAAEREILKTSSRWRNTCNHHKNLCHVSEKAEFCLTYDHICVTPAHIFHNVLGPTIQIAEYQYFLIHYS